MAKESNDEEYLDSLLNSVTNDEDNWFENELENIKDFDYDIDDNIDKIPKETTDITETDLNSNIAENVNKDDLKDIDAVDDIPEDDANDINIDDITSSEDEKLEDLMKLLDSYENEEESDNSVSPTENTGNDKKSDEKLSEKSDTDVKDTPKDKGKKKNKEKKESIFKKLFSKNKKDNSEDSNNIDSDEILNETGSAFDDMERLALDDVGIGEKNSNLFSDMESLDDIPEVGKSKEKEKKKEKKKKNNKKAKKQKVEKRRKVKVKKEKKEKIPSKEEYIKISPLFVVFAISVMVVFILAVYLGSSVFSYNSNIDEATNYYVGREYEKAYNILAGMNIKKEDANFYNQVENIMKVQKYINDFETYMELEMYVYALESLVKGIASFDANLNKASELGTYDILVEKSNEIDGLLKNYFNMSIEEARTLNQISNRADFSKAIYDKANSINMS